MEDNPPPRAGFVESLRKVGRTGMAVLQNRLELFSVELEEQRIQLVRILLLSGAAIFLGNTALLALSATIVFLANERARVPVLVGLTVLYVLAAVWAFLALRKALRSAPPPFQDTMSELKKDGDWLNPRK